MSTGVEAGKSHDRQYTSNNLICTHPPEIWVFEVVGIAFLEVGQRVFLIAPSPQHFLLSQNPKELSISYHGYLYKQDSGSSKAPWIFVQLFLSCLLCCVQTCQCLKVFFPNKGTKMICFYSFSGNHLMWLLADTYHSV